MGFFGKGVHYNLADRGEKRTRAFVEKKNCLEEGGQKAFPNFHKFRATGLSQGAPGGGVDFSDHPQPGPPAPKMFSEFGAKVIFRAKNHFRQGGGQSLVKKTRGQNQNNPPQKFVVRGMMPGPMVPQEIPSDLGGGDVWATPVSRGQKREGMGFLLFF